MAKINFVHQSDTALVHPYDESDPNYEPTAEEQACRIRSFFPRAGEPLQLFEVQLDPGTDGAPHVHTSDEIIYVLEGELRFGARVLGAGESVFVPAYTLYGFKVGDQGVRFLNFRPPGEHGMMYKDEFMKWRAEQGQAAGEQGAREKEAGDAVR